jgi:hypothetical protein
LYTTEIFKRTGIQFKADARMMPGMDAPSFLAVCLVGLATVFLLLGALALVFRLIALVFPARTVSNDAAVLAAVTAAALRAYPGTRVTRVEEER